MATPGLTRAFWPCGLVAVGFCLWARLLRDSQLTIISSRFFQADSIQSRPKSTEYYRKRFHPDPSALVGSKLKPL